MVEVGVLLVIVIEVNKQHHLEPLEVSKGPKAPDNARRSKRVTMEQNVSKDEQMRGEANCGVTTKQSRKLGSHQSGLGRQDPEFGSRTAGHFWKKKARATVMLKCICLLESHVSCDPQYALPKFVPQSQI
jgi:hypothetical protein